MVKRDDHDRNLSEVLLLLLFLVYKGVLFLAIVKLIKPRLIHFLSGTLTVQLANQNSFLFNSLLAC